MPEEKGVYVRLLLKDYARLEKRAEKNQRALGREAAVLIVRMLDEAGT